MVDRHSFLLVHSPLTGPYLWQPVAAKLIKLGQEVAVAKLTSPPSVSATYWGRHMEETLRASASLTAGPVVLVTHSGAGPLAPIIGTIMRQEVERYVFVDAALPLAGGGSRLDGFATDREREEFRARVKDGFVPPWPKSLLIALIRDPGHRRAFFEQLLPLPFAVYEEPLPSVPGRSDTRCSYLQFSDAYSGEAETATGLGWAVSRVGEGHFFMLEEPGIVAAEILAAVDRETPA